MSEITIYTDGACRGNPGPGGWGARLESDQHNKEMSGGETDTTNNRMELMAVIESLNSINNSSKVTVVTDSKYVMQGITEWIVNWKRRGWKTAAKKPVKNKDLWQLLDTAVSRHTIHWQWVKGHAGHSGNERADELANLGLDQHLAAIAHDGSVCFDGDTE